MAVGHGLEAHWGQWGRHPCGEDPRGEATRDAQAGVLPELPAQCQLGLGEEDEEDGEGVRDAELHDAGGDDATCSQECAACFGGFAGWEEKGYFFKGAELLF